MEERVRDLEELLCALKQNGPDGNREHRDAHATANGMHTTANSRITLANQAHGRTLARLGSSTRTRLGSSTWKSDFAGKSVNDGTGWRTDAEKHTRNHKRSPCECQARLKSWKEHSVVQCKHQQAYHRLNGATPINASTHPPQSHK